MSPLTYGVTEIAVAKPLASLTEIGSDQAGTGSRPDWIARRLAMAVVLTAVAYGQTYAATLADSAAGSRTPVLVALPALIVLIAAGYRTLPRGVGDAESNWIIAAMVAAPALAGFELLAHRLPTLSAVWHLQDFGAIVWFAALLTVLFGVRHAARMWPLWIFAVVFASPLPSILVTAVLGGSDTAALAPAVAAGAGAVYLACPVVARLRRAATAASCSVVSTAFVLTAGPHLPLPATALIVAAAFPAALTLLTRRRAVAADLPDWAPPQGIRLQSVAALAVMATALAVLNPATVRPAPLPVAAADWVVAAGLEPSSTYGFITRYAGPGASFVRYRPTASAGPQTLAVDVISTPDRAALTEIGDLPWYPAPLPVNFRPAPAGSRLPGGARIAHTDADATRHGQSQNWLAVTWEWQAGTVFQRVTILADQSLTAGPRLPEPAPVNLLDVSLRPALWVARQQPDAAGDVDDIVLRRAVGFGAGLTATATGHSAEGAMSDA